MTSEIERLIRKNWGYEAFRKIEKRLYERYELSLERCLFEFEKVDEIISEFLGYEAEGLEQRFIKKWSRK